MITLKKLDNSSPINLKQQGYSNFTYKIKIKIIRKMDGSLRAHVKRPAAKVWNLTIVHPTCIAFENYEDTSTLEAVFSFLYANRGTVIKFVDAASVTRTVRVLDEPTAIFASTNKYTFTLNMEEV